MESDIGKDIERTAFWLVGFWILGMTFKRRLGRWGEMVWWGFLAAVITFAIVAVNGPSAWFTTQADCSVSGLTATGAAVTTCTGGTQGVFGYELAGLGALAGVLLSAFTWRGAQVRRYRRQYARDGRNDVRRAQQERYAMEARRGA